MARAHHLLLLLLLLPSLLADDEVDADAERTDALRRSALEKLERMRRDKPGLAPKSLAKHASSARSKAKLAADSRLRAQHVARAADAAPAAQSLAAVSIDSYPDWLATERAGTTVVVFFTASFCKECQPQLAQFAAAAATLASRGYSPEVLALASLDTSLGGSTGAAPRLFASPCVSCPPCSGYPCIMTIDIDDEGRSSGALWGKNKPFRADLLVTSTVEHLRRKGIEPPQTPAAPAGASALPSSQPQLPSGASDGAGVRPSPQPPPPPQQQQHQQTAPELLAAGLAAAAKAGSAEKIAALLKAGADPNGGGGGPVDTATDMEGAAASGGGRWSPLHEVAARGVCVECAVLLAAGGARTALRDVRGLAVADVARKAVKGQWQRVLEAEEQAAAGAPGQPASHGEDGAADGSDGERVGKGGDGDGDGDGDRQRQGGSGRDEL